MGIADHSQIVKQLQSELRIAKIENKRLKARLQELIEKVDPILLLFGSDTKLRIRQICQEEMARYGVIDSYTRDRG